MSAYALVKMDDALGFLDYPKKSVPIFLDPGTSSIATAKLGPN